MSHYFLLHDARRFQDQARPVLGECWRRRNFTPGREFFAAVADAARRFAQRYHTGEVEPLSAAAAAGLPFDRSRWRHLAGEALLYLADDIPELETAPETYCALLAPGHLPPGDRPRRDFAPVEQALFGAAELAFGGGFYRPDQAGWNDPSAVTRLAAELGAVDPARWAPADLAALPDLADEDDRAEELAFAQEWFPALAGLYRRAADTGRVVVCERM
jgi:hypothetical protein